MGKYVLIYHGGGMPETEEEQAAEMAAWTAWYGQLGAAVADFGNPFVPMAKTVSSDGAVSDGAGDSMATGYTILSADSLGAAAEMAKGCPILKSGGQVAVYEAIEMEMPS